MVIELSIDPDMLGESLLSGLKATMRNERFAREVL
jgi:hypothetical protein